MPVVIGKVNLGDEAIAALADCFDEMWRTGVIAYDPTQACNHLVHRVITIEGSAPDLGEQLFSAEHFARSLGDFGVTIMLAGNIPGRTQTVAVAIYDAVEGGNGDLARWLVLAVSALAIALLTLANALAPKRA